jgi:PhoD-like phosphatase
MPSVWVVPGAPLEGGRGWRIWYSRAGRDSFEPAAVHVSHTGKAEAVSTAWTLLDAVESVDRRMGVLTVTLDVPSPGATYDVVVPELDGSGPVRWRTLPARLDEGVSFLLASCFWLPNDKEGAYGAAVRELTRLTNPAFKLLIGDQLYQDYPQNWLAPKSSFSLFADRYEEYWGNGAYQEVLQATPNFFLCDDHEFWNDFPERQIQLGRTWTDGARAECERAAQSLYGLYQRAANPDGASWYRFSIDRISFFVADSRSERTLFDVESPHFFGDEQWEALEAWAEELKGPGVLVLGQPLFHHDGDWKDHSLSNFRDDFGRLCALLAGVLARADSGARHDVLILTGDIHNARYTVATVAGVAAPPNVHEFVASPTSRVGPYLTEAVAKPPPTKINARHEGRPITWTVVLPESDVVPTVDNNIGSVTASLGNGDSVRFELTIWRIRPYDSRSIWGRARRARQPQGPLIPLYRKEIELR